ncbi:MAG: hypothetical protein M1822_006308 [Bathelium mastoideum]|nr:MAG: hypothetical protein M1822_006308 [Bathelium mastoideum]
MAVEHPDRVAQAEETTIAARRIELERNYVELLERRIANLESMLNEPKSAETTEDEEEEVKRKGTKVIQGHATKTIEHLLTPHRRKSSHAYVSSLPNTTGIKACGMTQQEMALGRLNPYHVDDKKTADPRGRESVEVIKEGDHKCLSKKSLMLLLPRLLGYSTRGKFWGQFRVDGTRKVDEPSSDVFENKLQLENEYKQMIKALVDSHGGEQ